jgi:DNA-binding transcriptional MocR family regulator
VVTEQLHSLQQSFESRIPSRPAYEWIADELSVAIERGDLLPGARLPAERLLAAELGVARGTVRAAYKLLWKRALVEQRAGSGTSVINARSPLASSLGSELASALDADSVLADYRARASSSGTRVKEDINLLSVHSPSDEELVRELHRYASEVTTESALVKSHGYFPLGLVDLRERLAEMYSDRGLPTTADQILITNGAQQAISLLAFSLVERGQTVVTEDPTLPGAIDVFRTCGAAIRTVAVSDDGADLDALAWLMRHEAIRLVYLIPSFHCPTGALMPEDARERLARLSRETAIPIVEDDTLAELSLGPPAPFPIAAWRDDAPILTIGSMSKLYWAGLRIGWLRGPRNLIAHLGRLKTVTDLGTSVVSQAIACRLIDDIDLVRARRHAQIRERVELLATLLGRSLPDWSWKKPRGGLSLWARLPTAASASMLEEIARDEGLLISSGRVTSPVGGFDDHLRIPFGKDAPVLVEGVERLARAWRRYAGTLTTTAPAGAQR